MVGFVEDPAGGSFYVTDGDGQSGGIWLPVGNPLAATDGKTDYWVRLTYRINYAAKTWDIYLDEAMVAADLGFLEDSLDRFEEMRLRGGNQGSAGFDFYYVGFANPLFDDADRDGVDDAYELANGMSSAIDDRGDDADFDTLSNLQEYVSGFLAGNPDSDGDGIHDGMDEEPGLAGSYALSAIPFEEDFEEHSLGSIDGVNLWSASSPGALVQGDEVNNGSKALAVSSGAASLSVSNQFDGSDDSKIWLRFQIKPTWWEATTYPQASDLNDDSTAVFFFQEGGKVVGLNGSNGQWASVDLDLDEDAWLEIAIFEDYVAQAWSLWVNNAPVFEGLGFANVQPYFRRFALKQFNSNAASIDDFSARYTDSVAVDSDFDGLLDSEEDINGNGIVDLGETDPNEPDTDADGIDDQAGILMRLWLRADAGVTADANGQVTQWADMRGIGDASQIDANRQPVLVADVLGGQPAIRFDGVDDFLAGLSDFDPSGEDFTFLVVQQKSGGHDKAAPLSYNVGSVSGAPLIRWGPEVGQLGINDVDVGPTGLYVELGPDHEDKPYVTTFCRSGDTLCVRALGPGQTERAMGTQTWTSGGDGHYYLGKKKDSADHFFGGDILEVRVYRGALSEADLLQLESEMAARYGVEIDLDDDGLLDSFERLYFGDLDEIGSTDFDDDGVDNLREHNLGLDPTVADAPAGLLGHPDLKLWLRADSGVTAGAGGKVSAWEDASGNGDIAYQTDSGKQPTLLGDALGGQPAVNFDGVDDYLEAISQFNASGSDFTMIVVQNRTGGHDKSAVFSYSTNTNATGAPLLRWGPNAGQFGINNVGVSQDGVYVDPGAGYEGQTFISSVSRSGGVNGLNGSLFLRNSGNGMTSEASGSQTWTSEDSEGFYVARKKVTEDHYFGGSIAEVLVYDSALSVAEIEAIEADIIAAYNVDADLDRDGLSDAWETQYFGSLDEDGDGDFDADGVANLREYNLGTNPNFDDNFHFVMARDDLQLWLSAGQGIELDEQDGVVAWRDLSGLNHDAVQGSLSSRPSWIESNAQHQPAVVFDGVNDYLSGLVGFDAAATDYTMVIVHNKTGGHDKAAPISLSTGSGDNGAPLLRWGPNAGQFGINNVGVNADGVYVDLSGSDESNIFLSTVRSEAGELTLTMDREGESHLSTGTRAWSTQASGGYFLGKKTQSNADHMLGGEIAEVLVFNSALSDEDLAMLQACLIARYGLTEDRDADGLTNDQEDLNGNGLVDPGETDPWNSDSDGDGIVDSLDYGFEADPANSLHVAQLSDVDGNLTWSTSFESSKGINVGPLGGQDSWMASRIVEVTDADAFEGTQSLSLTPPAVEGVSAAERLVDGSATPQIWVSFDAKLAAGRLPRPSEIDSSAALFSLTYDDTISAFNAETQQWLYAKGAAPEGQWVHYDVYLDYENQLWTLFVNQVQLFDALPFIDDEHAALERFKAWQKGSGSAGLLDQVVIGYAEPQGLQFTPELDFDGDGLSNALELIAGSDPRLLDMDGDGWSDFDEYYAQTGFADPDEYPDAVGLPSPWKMGVVGNAGEPMAWMVGDSWRLAASGSGQEGGFFYRTVDAGFIMIFKVTGLSAETEARLALGIREGLDADSSFIAAVYRNDGTYHHTYFDAELGGLNDFRRQPDGMSIPGLLMRLERTATGSNLAFSTDGILWRDITPNPSILPMDSLISLILNSGDDEDMNNYARVSVELIEYREDADFDGLYTDEEVALGTDPLLADTDGDTISDYDEVHYAHSDPLDQAGPEWQSYLEVGLGQATALKGQWSTNVFGEMQIDDISGKLEIGFSLPEAGVYQLRVPVRYIFEGQYNARRSLVIHHYIDGEFVQTTDHVQTISDGVDILELYLPNLSAGDHTYQLHWDNVYEDRWISLSGIELAEPTGLSGEDYDAWLVRYIGSSESLHSTATESTVSPAFIEGQTRYLSMMSLSDGTIAERAPGDAWFADVDLPADGSPLNLSIDFQNGGEAVDTSLSWGATNVLASGDIALRTGDSLRLTAGDTPDGTAISIDIDGFVYSTTDNNPIVHQFTEPGEVVIGATRGLENGSITVTVYPRAVIADAPALTRRYIRQWIWEGLHGLTADSGDIDMESVSDDGTDGTFAMYRTEVVRPRVLAARIGENGPIAQIVNTDGFWVRENVEGYYEEEFFEEGVYQATSHLICSPLPDDVTLQVRIHKAGVMFGDGSVELTLSNDDLDAFGRYDLVMYKPTELTGSVCHHVRVYENGEFIHLR